MRKRIALLAAVSMLAVTMPTAACLADTTDAAQSEETAGSEAQDGDAQDGNTQHESSGEDHIVTTKHTAVIQGKELAYTAEAGTMFLTTGGENCEIFFTAYTLDGVEDPEDRPITFAYNGGPGDLQHVPPYRLSGAAAR